MSRTIYKLRFMSLFDVKCHPLKGHLFGIPFNMTQKYATVIEGAMTLYMLKHDVCQIKHCLR